MEENTRAAILSPHQDETPPLAGENTERQEWAPPDTEP